MSQIERRQMTHVVTVERAQRAVVGSRSAFKLLCLAALISSWTGLRLGPLQLVDWALIGAVVAGAPAILTADHRVPRFIRYAVLGILIVYLIHLIHPTSLQYMASRYQQEFLQRPSDEVIVAQWLAALLVLPALVVCVCRASQKSVQGIAWAWAFGAAANGLVGLADYYGLTAIGAGLIDSVDQEGRQSGLASHVNNLGVACAIALPVAMHMLVTTRHKLIALITIAALGGGTLVSGSRASQAAAVIAIVLSLTITPQGRRALFPSAWAGLSAVVLVVIFRPDAFDGFSRVLRFSNGSSGAASDAGRGYLAQQGLRDFQHDPVAGVGFSVITEAHSVYLQTLATGGFVLLIALVIYFGSALRLSRDLAHEGSTLAGFAGCSVGTWLAVGVFENQLTDRYLYFPVAAIVVIAASVTARRGT